MFVVVIVVVVFTFCFKFVYQVLGLRTVHEQLLHLLSPSEQQELNLSHAFSPFAGV